MFLKVSKLVQLIVIMHLLCCLHITLYLAVSYYFSLSRADSKIKRIIINLKTLHDHQDFFSIYFSRLYFKRTIGC